MRDFNHTVNVLVKAYLNDTLEHTNCYACAVGNIICDANKYNYIKVGYGMQSIRLKENNGEYDGTLYGGGWHSLINWPRIRDDRRHIALTEIKNTGYSLEELKEIEQAFECCKIGDSTDESNFNGLMSVVDVLAKIHSVSLEQKSAAKAMFVKENL